MAVTFNQIMNAIGYTNTLLNKIRILVEHANDPNTNPTESTSAKQNAAQTLDQLQTMLNTVYQGLGRSQPTTTLTPAQLQSLGIV